MDPRIAQTRFLVEANDFSYLKLWEEWHSKAQWIDQRSGNLYKIASIELIHGDQIKERSICVSLRWALLEGRLVCFWYPTSSAIDYEIIEVWLQTHFQNVFAVNSENFHNLINQLKS